MFLPPTNRWAIPFDGSFDVRAAATAPPDDAPSRKQLRKRLRKISRELDELQYRMFCENRHSLLVIFQSLDAAGKDGTIRAVFRGINPAGVHVKAFAEPSSEDLRHDFLWRTSRVLPERGHIAVFNRSYYEEVLVVRVHPDILEPQNLPPWDSLNALWEARYASILEHEAHLARSGTIVLKFWLNVSREEQARRLSDRLRRDEKQWKFSRSDFRDRNLWEPYLDAYQEALNATSRTWAPWYYIPADNKPYMRLAVAEVIAETLRKLDPGIPEAPPISAEEREELLAILQE